MSLRARILESPFHVLDLPATCTRAEVERAAQMWLAKLDLGLQSAQTYLTPLGPRPRTPEAVRKAADELRDPNRRLAHEFWWLGGEPIEAPASEGGDAVSRPPDALVALGWRPKR